MPALFILFCSLGVDEGARNLCVLDVAHRKKKKGDKEKDREELSNQRLIALERARMTESRLAG